MQSSCLRNSARSSVRVRLLRRIERDKQYIKRPTKKRFELASCHVRFPFACYFDTTSSPFLPIVTCGTGFNGTERL
jgi:hypothetical protein